jgi:hypothetical protein
MQSRIKKNVVEMNKPSTYYPYYSEYWKRHGVGKNK